jgi:hypothetical protein
MSNLSQERVNSSPQLVFFLSEDEHQEGESSVARVADKAPLAGQTKSLTSTDVGSPRESEAEDSSVSSKGKELAPNPEKEEP